MNEKMSAKDFKEKLKSGEIKVDQKGKLIAHESLFTEKEMTEAITDEEPELKESLEIVSGLKEDINKALAIFIKGNTPSSKNSQEIIQMPVKNAYVTTCCNAKAVKNDKQYYCPVCRKHHFVKTRPSLIANKIVRAYKRNTAKEWDKYGEVFKFIVRNQKPPYPVGFYFIRDSKRRFDYINAAQVVQDIMGTGIFTTTKVLISRPWIEDDDTRNIIPVFLGTHKDKENAGVIIKPLPDEYKQLLKSYL